MYPDLEALRGSDGDCRRNSFFEQNCNQIFTKGPALTKEILEKVNAEIVPKKTYFCGREFKTKRVVLTAGLCLLFSASVFGAVLTWFTSTLDDFVLSQMILNNNSNAFKMWKNPPAKAMYYVYIFNYTNVEDYEDGWDDKLNLQELGPYTYEETLERIDVSFPTDDTLSFREKRTVNFRADLSNGSESDMLVVPNLAVIGGSAATKTRSYFAQLGFNAILNGLGEEAFIQINAGSFTVGYKDKLYDLAKTFLPEGTPDKMGLMSPRLGESSSIITINTGKRDINKYSMVQNVNGEPQYNYFFGDKCNSIQGTDGALNPPKLVQNKQPLYYLFPQVCRRMPLIFEKETTVLDGKVTAYQYTHPEDIFDSVEEKPENECYCNMEIGQCSLKGVFNVSSCNYGVPMFVSHPHFYRADPKLLEPFSGLKPNGRDYKSYFKLHPTVGFTMAARNILQLNVQVQKARSVSKVDMFEDGMILPIAWMDVILDDKTLPQTILDVINLITFTVPCIKLALKYGLLLTSIITLACLVLVLKRKSVDVQKCHPERLIRSKNGCYVTR